MVKIEICKEFSEHVGTRTREEGLYSGQEFYEVLLEPRFNSAVNTNDKLLINFDGGYGYGPSFIDESFGNLAEKYTAEKVNSILEFISNDEPDLINRVKEKINERGGKNEN